MTVRSSLFHLPSSFSIPSYFQRPLQEALPAEVQSLTVAERKALEGIVYKLAVADGVKIEKWDLEWGKNHLLDHPVRLTAALLELKRNSLKDQLQALTDCSSRVADIVVEHCPLIDRLNIEKAVIDDLAPRAQILGYMEKQKTQLNAKYPELKLCTEGSNDQRSKGWRARETYFLAFPDLIANEELQRFDYFASVVQELIDGDYDCRTATLILDRLLARESPRSTSSDFHDHVRLLELRKIAMKQIADGTISRGEESFCKDIFVVPSPYDKQGKFKPLHHHAAIKEVYAYECDRALGIGMTAPTISLRPGNFAKRIETIRRLFESAVLLKSQKLEFEAQQEKNRAFALLNAYDFPADVRNAIFGEMYGICGGNRQIDQLGEKLFFNKDGHTTTDRQKETAIKNYMDSEKFKEHLNKFGLQGSMQIWLSHCSKRAYEYIVKDTEGGAKLKTAPKALVHLYALLGMLKGSMDCASGNTLVEFDESSNRVANFWDMDDERSMPDYNEFWHIRLWQMGLPQCAEAFDKAFLLLFSDPALLARLKTLQSSPQICTAAYRAQCERLEKMLNLFQAELKKSTITLTPRELFFTLFPGSREDYERIKKGFNEDTRYFSEGVRISPIELFEFQLPEMGRNAWYTGDETEQRNIGANMRALYSPELP
jgi:hypothetical protein